ncbi:MAG: TSUP family transporter [Thermosynechococcaceae cyanobacterium MS004]|nr:TSUP family transporter [Thermosynechococcaceae cyanobacterium MS004]
MQFLILTAVFFATSIISVIIGSTSLITVPVMLQIGIAPRTALATNMLALTFMSIGAAIPFLKQKTVNIFSSMVATGIFTASALVDYPLGMLLSGATFVGGIIGSKVALKLNNQWLRRIFPVTVVILALKTMMG